MLACYAFRAKPGKEEEFEALLNNPAAARNVALQMGAVRNTLFLGGGRMVRVLEFPEGATPVPLKEVAAKDPKLREFLRKLAPLVEGGFDVDRPETLDAFDRRALVPLAYDVRV